MDFRQRLKIIKLLLIKNWKIRFHNKLSSVLLFLIPIIFSLVIVIIPNQTLYHHENQHEYKYFDENGVNKTKLSSILSAPESIFHTTTLDDYSLELRLPRYRKSMAIVYTPINSYTERLMKSFENIIRNKFFSYTFSINATKSKFELNKLLRDMIGSKNKDGIQHIYGIQFDFDDDFEVPKHLKYSISVSSKSIYNSRIYRDLNEKHQTFNESNAYINYGFIQLQAAIDLAHISIATNNTVLNKINVLMQRMPIPERDQIQRIYRERLNDTYFLIPWVIMFSLLIMLPVIVKRIVEEKATKMTEYLVLLGIGRLEHWISVIVDAFMLLCLQNLIIAFILDIPVIKYITTQTENTLDSHSLLFGLNFSLFLFFLILFLIQSILLVCLISVLFKSPNKAVIATILIWILSFVVPILYLAGRFYPKLSLLGNEWLLCLIPNCALLWFTWISHGLNTNAYFGATWSHISDAGYLAGDMSLGHVFIAMLISYPLYGLLIWYLSSIVTTQQTFAKPLYFPVKYIYDKLFVKNNQGNYETMFDKESYPIAVSNLSKKYKSMFGLMSEHVLKNIDLEVKDKLIAVVLGPNGSGKTTLVNVITGLLDYDGQVIIGGHDISKERELAQNMVGICPQQNVYYKWLTVREHLQLFHDLKIALRGRNDGYGIQQLIQLLDLESDLNKEAFKLSGGTMRRLVLGMALIGPNDILILDEPTAGLDPKVKQKVWDLIIDAKNSRSVLITSHHLEEANLLSDMIVVLSHGVISFIGSTLKMKKQFGSGYQLKVLKNSEFGTESQITKIISKYAKIKSFDKNDMRDNEELQYGLNFEDCKQFSRMFDELESKSGVLAINSLSLGMTTLEDCYAKIIHRKDDYFQLENNSQLNDDNDCLIEESIGFERRAQKPYELVIQQMIAILVKRLNYLSKHYILFLTLIIIPMFFMLLLFVAINAYEIGRVSDRESLVLKSQKVYGNGKKAFIVTNESSFENFISSTYLSYLKEENVIQEKLGSDKIQESLLFYSEKSFPNYFYNLLYGFSTHTANETVDLIVWHNYAAYHSLPISLNLVTTTLLRQLTNDNSYDITVTNNPLHIDSMGRELSYYHSYIHPAISLRVDLVLFMFGFAFASATYVLLPIHELRTKFKLLQLMSGLNPVVYWLANFTFDVIVHSICSLLYASVYNVLDRYQFIVASKYSFISIYLMFLLYGFSFIPFAYLISFFCKKPSTGFAFTSLFNIIGTTITIFLILLLSTITIETETTYYLISELLLILCPSTLFLSGINFLHRILGYNTYCHIMDSIDPNQNYCESDDYRIYNNSICCPNSCLQSDQTAFDTSNSGYLLENGIVYMDEVCHEWLNPFPHVTLLYVRFICYGLTYFILILIIELRFYRKLLRFLKKIPNNNNNNFELQESECEEVKRESEYVSQLTRSGNLDCEAFIVDKLTKQFKKCLIVPNKLSFTVQKQQCFGLLGINGSGKTTTFRLITGDLSISSGNAYLSSGANLLTNRTEFYSRIGYCPQNDALLDKLTGMQTLRFFRRLRGLQSNDFDKFITDIVEKFELKNIINKPLSTYSGGNRRKISLAIAIIGSPSLLLLDEPTNGVDSDSRFKIWQLLRRLLISSKTSILLTSHNMEECEALCSRLAIMSNGVLKTIGSISDLKNRYAKGFLIVLKVNLNTNENVVEDLKAKVYQTFGEKCVLKYESFGVIYYHLVSENVKLSIIFYVLETFKTEFKLEDYFVSNASLEQAFLSIVEH